MNRKTLLIVVAIAVVVVLGALYWYEDEIRGYPPPWQEQTANPASRNCVATLGGSLEIKDTTEGQVGICHLPDGRSCEEWALFRNEGCTDPTVQ